MADDSSLDDAASARQSPADQPPVNIVSVNGVPPDLTRLVTEHYAVLFRYAYRLCGSVPDAEDLTQQTFLAAQSNLSQLRDVQSARSWLFAILRNAYLRVQRKPRPTPAATLKLNIDNLPDGSNDDLQIDQELLQTAINELTDDFKLVVVMFYFEGLSYRQIAEQLHLPLGTVMSRLSRAKGRLRARLFDTDANALAVHAQGPGSKRGLPA